MNPIAGFFKVLMAVMVFLFRPRLMVFIFKFIGIMTLVLFVYTYYYAFQTFRQLHQTYLTGRLQTNECGYEYMEKESGITHLYDAMTNPESGLNARVNQTLDYSLYIIALLSVAVLALALYYLTNDPEKPSFRRDSANPTWTNLTKVGLYIRYLLLPAFAAIGLLFYYNKQRSIYIPDFQGIQSELDPVVNQTELEDPVLREKKIGELDRSIEATVSRQFQTPFILLLILSALLLVYSTDAPISRGLIVGVYVALIVSMLLLTGLTRFYGKLRLILQSRYVEAVQRVNASVLQMIKVPEFRDYYFRNARRLEKYSEEPFVESQIERLAGEGKLHYYILHHATQSDELAFMTAVEKGKSRSNKSLTWSPVVAQVRANLNTMRQADAEIEKLFKSGAIGIFGTFLLPFILVLFVGFHIMYQKSPMNTTLGVIALLVLIFLYTFLRNTVSLVRPQDPVEEIVVPVDKKPVAAAATPTKPGATGATEVRM
jgi:hypothetical protein